MTATGTGEGWRGDEAMGLRQRGYGRRGRQMQIDLTGHEIDLILFDLPKLIAYYTDMIDDDPIESSMTASHLAELKQLKRKLERLRR